MMKHYLLTIVAVIGFLSASSQLPPNGGFEDWITQGTFHRPIHWTVWYLEFEDFCDQVSFLEETSDAYEGESAVYLVNEGCLDAGGTTIFRPGLIQTGDSGVFPPYTDAVECQERPEFLSLYYKYEPVGADTAVVAIKLYNYDEENYEITDMIGIGQVLLTEPVSEYTQLLVSIEYLLDSTPQFASVVFNTSFANFRNAGNDNPNLHGHVGTSMTIDKVEFQGGTLGLGNDITVNSISISPNPASSYFSFEMESEYLMRGSILQVFNAFGQVVYSSAIVEGMNRIDCGEWSRGMYCVSVLSSGEEYSVGRVLIE